jgi:hypothetical protein
MIDSNHPHKHGYIVLRVEANRLNRMADDVEKIISLVHRIYGERGLDVLDGVSGGEKTPRDDINEWRAKADSLLVSADVLQYGEPEEPEEPETIQDPKVPEVEQSCWTCGYDFQEFSDAPHGCSHPSDDGVKLYVCDCGAFKSADGMPVNRTLVCPGWKSASDVIGSVEGP